MDFTVGEKKKKPNQEKKWVERRGKTWSFPRVQFSSVESLSCIRLFAISWTVANQASLSIANSHNLLKLMSIELMRPSNHLILYRPHSPPALNLSQHQGLFQWVSSSHQVAKLLEFQLQHQSFQ